MLKKIFKLSVFKLSLLLTFLFIALAITLEYAPQRLSFLKSLALKVNSDTQFKLRGARPLSDDIVIVAIDDRSIEKFGKQKFTLNDVYAFEDKLDKLHPENKHIKDKIRQQLQVLRDKGYVEFLGRGVYQVR